MKKTKRMSRWTVGLALAVALGMGVFPAAAAAVGTTTRASVDNSGGQVIGGPSLTPSVSGDGRYVAFASGAIALVPGDTNPADDIFVRDRVLNTTTRVSVSSAGVQADGESYSPVISANGRYVAFLSAATNLVSGDTNGVMDVFVRDRTLNTTTRLSCDSYGVQADGACSYLSISADGRYVTFRSAADNLVPSDTNGRTDVFLRDCVLNTTKRVSVNSTGIEGNGDCWASSVCNGGRYVAFLSAADNLVGSDTNAVADIFVRDVTLGTTTLVSKSTAGVLGDSYSDAVSMSADGRYVAFLSSATNLVSGDTNAVMDVFVRDRTLNTTTRVSVSSAGVQSNNSSYAFTYGATFISADGRCVAFISDASNLVASDTNGRADIFVRDRVTNTTTRVSVSTAGAEGDNHSFSQSISGDGRFTVFGSMAANLVSNDTNAQQDVFVNEAPTVATSITIKTTATSARTGNVPILSGAVTPFGMVGKNIVVWVKKPGKAYFSYSSNRTVYSLGGNAAWQYKYYFKPGMVKGYYVFKAVVPASPGFLTSTSPTTVTIRLR